jgi:CRISPR-associated protein Csm1
MPGNLTILEAAMDEKDAVYPVALAGLLHDIGKFAQRAGWMKGAHPEVGGEFVRQLVPQAWREGLYPVMGHHDKPLQGYATKLVALADRLSAGERIPQEEEQPPFLRSIFCSLTADGQQAPRVLYWPLQCLKMTREAIFPRDLAEFPSAEDGYRRLWGEFTGEARRLMEAHQANGSLPVYLESLLLLLQRYTWCVPSASYRSMPDVSLYDHSRITAGLAVCLLGTGEGALDGMLNALEDWFRARQKDSSAPPPAILEGTKVALLVGGDISGVQDFIYTITARGATSALRGRSFYLQLLTEAVARYVLRRLGLPITNLIYQGGGHFYLLARPNDLDHLEEVRREVSRVLLAHHRGDLYLALEAVPLTAADFYDGRISGRWEKLGQALRQAKQRRFAELGAELVDLFQPEGHGGNEEEECQVCGREYPDTRKDDDTRKCPPCRSYEGLGETLRRARYLWMAQVEPAAPGKPLKVTPGGWEEVLAAFGMRAGAVEDIGKVPDTGGPRWVLALKDDAMDGLRPDAYTVVGRRLLVNVTPILTEKEYQELRGKVPDLPVPGSVKPFSVMAYQSRGIRRLGVLRMDVDNLGKLFSEGLGNQATLSRVAALSFAISLFFEGWVEVLAERPGKEEGRDRLYSIYSGGDDLFFVGSWDAVVELARAIRADFSRFAAEHPGMHASAGIALVGGKYPLYQAAEDAGRAEKQAKALHWRDESGERRTKDAISFLGQAVPWHRFGTEACEEKNRQTVHGLAHLLDHLTASGGDGKGAPKALLQMLIRLQEQYQEVAEARARLGEDRNRAREPQVYYGPWMWRGYYFLKRMARRLEREQGEASQVVNELAEGLHGENFRAIEWIGLAARWAELLGRE